MLVEVEALCEGLHFHSYFVITNKKLNSNNWHTFQWPADSFENSFSRLSVSWKRVFAAFCRIRVSEMQKNYISLSSLRLSLWPASVTRCFG